MSTKIVSWKEKLDNSIMGHNTISKRGCLMSKSVIIYMLVAIIAVIVIATFFASVISGFSSILRPLFIALIVLGIAVSALAISINIIRHSSPQMGAITRIELYGVTCGLSVALYDIAMTIIFTFIGNLNSRIDGLYQILGNMSTH